MVLGQANMHLYRRLLVRQLLMTLCGTRSSSHRCWWCTIMVAAEPGGLLPQQVFRGWNSGY
jgi:hypothetical protein